MNDQLHNSGSVSRRSALQLLVGSACVGAAWGTGLTALSNVGGPSATLCGHDDWQLILIECGRSRALVLMGIPSETIDETLTRMMGSFRQRIDLVIGAPTAIEQLPSEYRSRWNVQRTVVLGGADTGSLLAETASIASPVGIDIDSRLNVSLIPVIEDQWKVTDRLMGSVDRWIVSAHANGSTIRLAEQLEDLQDTIGGSTAVAVAPRGNLRSYWSFNPDSAVAINGDHVPEDVITSPESNVQDRFWLVSVFPDDITHLKFMDQGVAVPEWARSVQFIDGPE